MIGITFQQFQLQNCKFFILLWAKSNFLMCILKQLVRYCHPDYLSTRPVSWHDELCVPVYYQSNLPTLSELCSLEPYTCLVLDDLYEECINSKAIDYLFRVLSGKRNISVIIMTQRYFSNGKFGMNILWQKMSCSNSVHLYYSRQWTSDLYTPITRSSFYHFFLFLHLKIFRPSLLTHDFMIEQLNSTVQYLFFITDFLECL